MQNWFALYKHKLIGQTIGNNQPVYQTNNLIGRLVIIRSRMAQKTAISVFTQLPFDTQVQATNREHQNIEFISVTFVIFIPPI